MMDLYYVKTPLYGVQAGRVERFAAHKALQYLKDGSIEAYDPQKHRGMPGAPQLAPIHEAAKDKRDQRGR